MSSITDIMKMKAEVKQKKEDDKILSESNVEIKLQEEVNFIRDDIIRYFVEWALTQAPEYFWYVPCTKTGEYHPSCVNTKFGLVKHTKYCVRIAIEMFKNTLLTDFDRHEEDILIASLILHDMCKRGIGEFKRFDKHGRYVVKHLEAQAKKSDDPRIRQFILSIEWNIMSECIGYHLGEFITYKSKVVWTKYMKFVHMCDYIASMRVINYIENL